MSLDTPRKLPRAEPGEVLVEPPTRKARPLLVGAMAVAQLGLFLALMTPIMVSLAIKVQTIVPEERQVTALGIVTSIGSVAAMLANPIFGRISDRTTSRFGRRRPWLVVGMFGLMASLLIIALGQSVATVTVGFFLASIFANAALAAFVATVADHVPMFQRGRVSGLIGIMQNVAPMLGTYVAQMFTDNMLMLFMVPGVAGFVLVMVLVVLLPDARLPKRPAREAGWKTFLMTFWVNPRKHPDFAWAWISRFLLTLASYMFTTFRLLYLQHELSLSAAKATEVMATGVLIYTIAVMVGAQSAGWLSDRLRRRKAFIALSTLVFGVGMLLLVWSTSIGGFYFAEAVLGLGFGVYMGVDLALVIDVLPNPDDSSKDLGVFNIAMSGPQVIAPAVGASLVNTGGGDNYGLLLGGAAVVCLLGALAILPVRQVR